MSAANALPLLCSTTFFCYLLAPRRDNNGHMIIFCKLFNIETTAFGTTTLLMI